MQINLLTFTRTVPLFHVVVSPYAKERIDIHIKYLYYIVTGVIPKDPPADVAWTTPE